MIDITTTESICFISLNSPPVNAIGAALRKQLLLAISNAYEDATIELVVLGSGLPLFCAGADIHEFRSGQLEAEPDLPAICAVLDSAPKLTLAAINGTAMGGALELALACDYRMGLAGTKLGLPEVQLGLIPGAGGTQRLPRIIDIETATQMMVTGKPLSAEEAFGVGLLDRVVPREEVFQESVLRYARELLHLRVPPRHSADRSIDMSGVSETFFEDQRTAIAKKLRGQIAPLRALESIEAASQLSLDEGLRQERASFDDLLTTSQARGMIHLFFAEREALKIPGLTPATTARQLHEVGVAGAGTMGVGISIALLDAGLPVVLLDNNPQALESGFATIAAHYQRAVEKNRIDRTLADKRLGNLKLTQNLMDLSSVDLIIEAVFESMSVKQALFRELDDICKPGAILATNTSTLNLDAIAAATRRPEDVIGLHFFSPANLMRLLEIVRGDKTANDVLKSAQQLSRRINKLPVVVKVCFGFVGNRMLEPYFREASRLMLEGASATHIDRVLTDFGMAMGVLSMGDLAGIDVGFRVRSERRSEFEKDPGYQAIQDKLYELGRYGQKTGRGVYRYEDRRRVDDPEVTLLCEAIATELGISRRTISDTEILERCLYPLINEGFLLLEEGIAYRAGDCDLIWVNGYGFPSARGGPMHYASELGYKHVLQGMDKYRKALGDYGEMWFTPAASLREAADML
ncbi:MAG: enoyl-CoA hydratase/isomerase family protein [Granulosicoccus sp.]|nr:enoyl-CoA hydratase/isomerase family protein [Granulosicoccus sp.]